MNLCFLGDARNVHLRNVATRLASRGHGVRVVCHKPAAIAGLTVERFRIPEPGLRRPFRWTTRRTRYLRGFLRRFDCVIVFFLHDWGFTPDLIDDGCLVAYPQGSDIVPPPGETPPSDELIEKRVSLLRHARSVGCFGPRFAAIVARFAGMDAETIDPLPLGVDGRLFQPVRTPADRTAAGESVGYLKGFREVYGPTYLVQAMPMILAERPRTRFEMVGNGPQLETCRALAAELGVADSVTWIDRQPQDRVPEILAGWDVSVMPSLCESFGVAAVESQAMGVPVVASNVGGLPDAIRDGVTGVLVEPRSPEAIAEAVVGLLHNPDRRTRLGEAGRAWVRARYEWSMVIDQWEETLSRARDRSGDGWPVASAAAGPKARSVRVPHL